MVVVREDLCAGAENDGAVDDERAFLLLRPIKPSRKQFGALCFGESFRCRFAVAASRAVIEARTRHQKEGRSDEEKGGREKGFKARRRSGSAPSGRHVADERKVSAFIHCTAQFDDGLPKALHCRVARYGAVRKRRTSSLEGLGGGASAEGSVFQVSMVTVMSTAMPGISNFRRLS